MSVHKLVSVIIPTHKGSNSVGNAIESVLAQDYKKIEVIVVDDNGRGTTEQYKTEQVLKKYMKDLKVHYIAHEENINGAAARNTGFRASSGDYICLLDDDDVYYPSKVRIEVEELEKLSDEWGMVYCSVEKYVDGKINSVNRAVKSGYLLQKLLLHQVIIGSDSLMVRRNVFKTLKGFDESFRRHQDFEFTARVAAKYKIKAVSQIGVKYNFLGRNSPKSRDIAIMYRKHYLTKMLPHMECFNKSKINYIIYYNMVDFVGHLIKRGKIFKAYNEFNILIQPWISSSNFLVFFCIIINKAYFKVYRNAISYIYKIQKNFKRFGCFN